MADNVIELIIRTTDAASQQIQGIAKQLDVLGHAADIAKDAFAALAVGFSVDKLVESITAAETATADLNRQFAAFGSTVGISRQDMEDFAESTSRSTTLTSESLKEAQANLLNYTTLTGKAFEQARDLVVDLAAKMGGDAAEAAELLGRSLQNPVSGIRLLAQVGVTLTQSQRETIASLVQTGDAVQAQNFILYELQQRVHGAAAEINNTLGGALTNLKNSFANAFTGTGADVGGLVDQLHELAQQVQDPSFQQGIQAVVSGIVEVGKASAGAVGLVHDFATAIGEDLALVFHGSDKPFGSPEALQEELEGLQHLLPEIVDPGQAIEISNRIAVIQKALDALADSAHAANSAMGGANFGLLTGTDWEGNAAKPPPLFDPLQRPIQLSPLAEHVDINQAIFGGNASADAFAQFTSDTESELDKAFTTLEQHIAERAQLVKGGFLDATKAAAQNQFDQIDYDALVTKTFAPVQVHAQKIKETLTDVEKEGIRVGESLTTAFESFFVSGELTGRNFVKTMIGFFEEILAKALSIDLVSALGLNKLFTASSNAGNVGQTAGLFGAIFSAFTGHAGGGQAWSPTWVGEDGPELLFPGSSGATVMNQRQLAYAGGGGGNGLVYAPVNNIQMTVDDSKNSTAQMFQFLTRQQTQQQADFERKLSRNGYKLK